MFFLCLWVMFVSLAIIIRAFVLLLRLDLRQINLVKSFTNECIFLVPFWRRLIWACAASWRLVTVALIVWCIVLLFLFCLGIVFSELLSNENADVPDVMNTKRKFDVSLDGTLHTTILNAFVLTPAVRKLSRLREMKERKYQLPVASFEVRDVNVLVA